MKYFALLSGMMMKLIDITEITGRIILKSGLRTFFFSELYAIMCLS
jgi:hypothetical protein